MLKLPSCHLNFDMSDPTWMGEHGLISRHLQSHYKRINTAKGTQLHIATR